MLFRRCAVQSVKVHRSLCLGWHHHHHHNHHHHNGWMRHRLSCHKELWKHGEMQQSCTSKSSDTCSFSSSTTTTTTANPRTLEDNLVELAIGSTIVLFFSNVFPESNASAAGVRTRFFLEQFVQHPSVSSVHYATPASSGQRTNPATCTKKKEHDPLSRQQQMTTQDIHQMEALGIRFHHVPLNDSIRLQEFLQESGAILASMDENNKNDNPKNLEGHHHVLIIMDRFFTEEAYSFHIHNLLPQATIVLDMQDMHSLRWSRQAQTKKSSIILSTSNTSKKKNSPHHGNDNNNNNDENVSGEAISSSSSLLFHQPSRTNDDDDDDDDAPSVVTDRNLQRELASIHRSDLTLVCSPKELQLLQDRYQIPKDKLCLASYFVSTTTTTTTDDHEGKERDFAPSWMDRKDFVFLGGFQHPPNVDAVHQLKHVLWPLIRQAMMNKDEEDVHLHVYGAYCPIQLQKDYHDETNGFLMHGFHPSLETILADKRVLLAPLRYGAGIKGKIIDAWKFGTPVVTTPMGCEGLSDAFEGGRLAVSHDDFVQQAMTLYQNEQAWTDASLGGRMILEKDFSVSQHWHTVHRAIENAILHQEQRREQDIFRSILWQQSVRSTEYFSKWIECKEQNKSKGE